MSAYIKPRDFLRLEVRADATGVTNLMPNPRGELGAWGWITPVSGSSITAYRASASNLRYRTASGANDFYSIPIPVTAGQWVNAIFFAESSLASYVPYWRARFDWLDSDQNYFAFGGLTGYVATDTGSGPTNSMTPAQAPSGAAYVRLHFFLYGNNSGGNPSASKDFTFYNVMLSEGASSSDVATLFYQEPGPYTDILDTSLAVSTSRQPLDVGTLSATVLDTTLDPTQTDALRPGRPARLRAERYSDGVYIDLYNGNLDRAEVSYDLRPDVPAGKDTRITLSAADANTILANVPRYNSVGTAAELAYVLEPVGVPWDIDGSGNQFGGTLNVVAYDNSAKALGQVELTRDTLLGYAWTDARGVLMFRSDRTAEFYDSTNEPYVFDEDDYSDITIGFDTDSIINQVTIVTRVTSPANSSGTTTESSYGPFVDTASVSQWGPKAATFTVLGTMTSGERTAYAAAVLAANSQPVVRPSQIVVPIRYASDITPEKALIDLYARARVKNTAKGVDETLRVTSVEHNITPDKWILTLGLTGDGVVTNPSR